MKRRLFLAALGGTAIARPFVANGQEPRRTYRIGFLIPTPRERPAVAAFFDELRINGFVEGQNLLVLPGGFDPSNDALAERAAALVKAAPDVIVGGPELALRALQAETRAIPLVGMAEDMVAAGLAASLARPGGNVTGISLLSPELDGKRQDILMEAVPGNRRMASLYDSNVTSRSHLQDLKEAARTHGIEVLHIGVARVEEVVTAIDAAKASGAQAVNFLATPLFSIPGTRGNGDVLDRVAELHLPAIYQWPETAEGGGLIGYGPHFTDVYRQRARMVVKVLRGAKPADLPIEQPTKFELVVNLKTAKELGLTVPQSILVRADEVIE
jgi:putative ABC transport system substrate-binding protein